VPAADARAAAASALERFPATAIAKCLARFYD
jgi:hypothetical protein